MNRWPRFHGGGSWNMGYSDPRPSQSDVRAARDAYGTMLAKDDAPVAKSKRSAPAREAEKTTTYNPFLKAEHLQRGLNKLTLTGWTRRMNGKFGPQIIVEVTDERERTYDFAIGIGSPNHRILFKTMGNDETRWKGQISVEAQRGRNATFVAIVETSSEEPPF
jgi:hypothetical protein